ncbi:multidrug transporter [Kribbella antibiotica]|uniref:Multidrug transporter n=1 Tax=Kribbella antibiotica TaxID=190195 RepID=A0A4R4ZQ73_9ACTN|nr:multidrug transporter [Kribbella antibiotica]
MAILEIFNIALIGWVVFGVADAPVTVANVAGYGATAFLLAVGASYWVVKLRQVRAGQSQLRYRVVFRRLRFLCAAVVVIAGILVGIGFAGRVSGYAAGVVLWVLAAAEYVNYFHWQLMYDNRAELARLSRTGRLARAHLWRDLRRTS